MADSPLHMLNYWIEDKGMETALIEYYPELLRTDFRLQYLFAMKEVADRMLQEYATKLTEKALDEVEKQQGY